MSVSGGRKGRRCIVHLLASPPVRSINMVAGPNPASGLNFFPRIFLPQVKNPSPFNFRTSRHSVCQLHVWKALESHGMISGCVTNTYNCEFPETESSKSDLSRIGLRRWTLHFEEPLVSVHILLAEDCEQWCNLFKVFFSCRQSRRKHPETFTNLNSKTNLQVQFTRVDMHDLMTVK